MRIKTGRPIEASLFGFDPDGSFPPVTAISTDSGEIVPGDLFVAIPGEKTDGAAYIGEALGRGASLVLSHRAENDPRVGSVPDPVATLTRAAALFAGTIPHKTVAITGSYGKTTLRCALTEILSPVLPVAVTEGNRNTDLALALTLLSMKSNTAILLAELGMRGRGEIERLSKLVRPDIAVITAIGNAHLGRLGSIREIREAKCEIVGGMTPDGTLLYPANDPLLAAGVAGLPVRVESVSTDPAIPGTFTLEKTRETGRGATVSLFSGERALRSVRLPDGSEATVTAAAFCFAICEKLGIDRAVTKNGLSRITPPPLRRQVEKVGEVTVILDCYNASPEPTLAALEELRRTPKNRLFLVLGDMLELGESAIILHRAVGRRAAGLLPARLLCVGELAREYGVGAVDAGLSPERISSFSPDELPAVAGLLGKELFRGDLLFIKGSRALALERLLPYLKQAEI